MWTRPNRRRRLHRPSWVVTGVLLLGACSGRSAPPTELPLADLAAGRIPDAARAGEVRLRATVTYVDPAWTLLFLQDGPVALYVSPKGGDMHGAVAGQYVEVRGRLDTTAGYATIARPSLHPLGEPPPRLPVRALAGNGCDAPPAWTEVRGIVRRIHAPEGPHLHVLVDLVAATGQTVTATIQRAELPDRLVDSEVTVRGVCGNGDGSPGSSAVRLWVPDTGSLSVTRRAPDWPFATPATPIGAVVSGPAPPHAVHVRGRLLVDGDTAELADASGTIAVSLEGNRPPGGTLLDAFGFVERTGGRARLADTFWLPAEERAATVGAAPDRAGGVLTSVAAVRELPRRQAREGRPVSVEGIVTYWDPLWRVLFVSEGASGIYVEDFRGDPALAVGDRVRLSGRTAPGNFAPSIADPVISVIGHGGLPSPAQVPFDRLASGAEDARWIEVSGIVRAVRPGDQDHVFLELVSGGIRVVAEIPAVSAVPDYLIDSRVRLRSVAGSLINADGQLTGVHLFVPSLARIIVEESAPADALALPVRTVASLLRFDPERSGHRLHIRGTVALVEPAALFVADDTGGVAVSTAHPGAAVGDEVDVIGFPAPGPLKPRLTDAVVRATGRRRPRPSRRVTMSDVLSGRCDAELVSVAGRVSDAAASGTEYVVVVESGGQMLTTHVPRVRGASWIPPERGSQVVVSGIAIADAATVSLATVTRSVWLVARSPADVVITRAPSWWTVAHTVWTLSAALLLLAGSFGWVAVLRRKVSAQTEMIRVRLEGEAALETRFRDLVDNASDFIASCDRAGRVRSVNAAGARLLGVAPEAAVGRSLHDLAVPAHRERLDRLGDGLRTGPATCEIDVPGSSGEPCTLELAARPVRHRDGSDGFQVIGRDVTAYTRLARALEQARSDAEATSRAKSEFVANMSHEVRTPMNGIMGMTELLLASEPLDEQRPYLQMIQSSAGALLHVINDVLDLSKIEAGHLELDPGPFVLHDMIAEATHPVAVRAQQKGLELTYRVAPGTPDALIGDVERLKQVLLNLLGNAVKFTSAGDVHLEARPAAGAADPIEAGAPCTIEFRVSDTGIGIPAEKHEAIFAAFTQADSSTTRRFGGTGLGLAISARLVQMMGGRIRVESVVGTGSTFTVEVPLTVAQPAAAPPPALALGGLRTLIVDDHPINRRLIQEMTSGWGMRPTAVPDADAALDQLRRARAEGDAFALVITDMHMPDTDGIGLCQRVRACPDLSGLPILMLTSANSPGDIDRCRQAGVAGFLVKPVGCRALLAAVQRALGGTAPGAAARSEASDRPDRAAAPLRILLAEDNRINQRLTSAVLTRRGHAVEVAADGRQALAAIAADRFDLVLMDVQMPELSGFEVTERVRQDEASTGRRRVPIIAMTAHALAGDRERCLACGMDDYLSKPITSAALVDRVERIRPRG